MTENKEFKLWKGNILLVICMSLVVSFFCANYCVIKAEQASSVSIANINYDDESLTIQANAGDQKIYISDSSQKKWELIPQKLDNNSQLTMDISWITKASNYVLSLKGDKSTTPIKVTIPKQKTNLKVKLNPLKANVTFSNLGNAKAVEWRKSTVGKWNVVSVQESTIVSGESLKKFQEELERCSLKGASLYFRVKQTEGTAQNSVGERASKEVALSIPKRAAAPSVTVNFSKMQMTIEATKEYRLSGSNTDWISGATSSFNMEKIAADAMYIKGEQEEPKDVSLDVRVKATTSKVASQTKTVLIPAQEAFKAQVNFEYTGSTQCQITVSATTIPAQEDKEEESIAAPSSQNPYEYTINKTPEKTFDIKEATWTSITSDKAVVITSKNAPEGSFIYIRKKATSTTLPSAIWKEEVKAYPTAASLDVQENLEKVCGVEISHTFTIKIPNPGASSLDISIKSIKFGGKEATFSAGKMKKIEVSDTNEIYYTITAKITGTDSVEAVQDNIGKKLSGIITLSNGDVIENQISLFLYPPTTVVGKRSIETYQDINMYTGLDDSTEQKVTLEMNIQNSDKITKGLLEGADVLGVKTVKYADYTLIGTGSNPDYRVQSVNPNGETTDINDTEYILRLIITKEGLENCKKNIKSTKLNASQNFEITLNNGEKMNSAIAMTVKQVISITSSSNSIGVSQSAYEKYQDYLKKYEQYLLAAATNSDAVAPIEVAAVTIPSVTLKIDSDFYLKDDTMEISSVTWNGKDILDSFEHNKNTITIKLDIEKLMNIATTYFKGDSTAANYSAPIKIVLKSSKETSEITLTGYQITVIKSATN